jgi:hypothetical protein
MLFDALETSLGKQVGRKDDSQPAEKTTHGIVGLAEGTDNTEFRVYLDRCLVVKDLFVGISLRLPGSHGGIDVDVLAESLQIEVAICLPNAVSLADTT